MVRSVRHFDCPFRGGPRHIVAREPHSQFPVWVGRKESPGFRLVKKKDCLPVAIFSLSRLSCPPAFWILRFCKTVFG